MLVDADLLILGGGCAGLSLGQRLAEQSFRSERALILEERTIYTDDRSWCFWRFGEHRFDHLIAHSWSKMRLASEDTSVMADCKSTPYQMLSGLTFYDEACNKIKRASNVELSLGVRVMEPPRRVGAHWHVETNKGMLVSRQIVDTIPLRVPKAGDAVLWQSFFGQEVLCERAVFDPLTVSLMDFGECLQDGVLFHYVLPISATRALIETTVFGPLPLLVTDLAKRQAASVAKLCNGYRFEVTRSENGILPMGLTKSLPESPPGYVRAGLMSGGARPSTGYAFQRIQSWAETAAAQIGRGLPPATHKRDPIVRQMMDGLFLRVVRANPERGAELFLGIFESANPARVIRFLSDRGSLLDCASVVKSLPKALFLNELWRGLKDRSLSLIGAK